MQYFQSSSGGCIESCQTDITYSVLVQMNLLGPRLYFDTSIVSQESRSKRVHITSLKYLKIPHTFAGHCLELAEVRGSDMRD